MAISQSALGIPSSLVNMIQDRTLERTFHDSLVARYLYRAEAQPELWAANLGERHVMTRPGLIPVSTAPLTPGSEPSPREFQTEQWDAEAFQYSETIDTHMPSSYVALASMFLRNTVQLGINAAQTMNRLPRNKLFVAYLSGETNATAAAGAAAVQIQVASVNGFTQQLSAAGRLESVSPANPIPVSFPTTVGEPDNFVVAAAPANPAFPFGPGVITLQSGLTVGVAGRDVVLAGTAARRIRVGGAASVDGIGATNTFTLNSAIAAASYLRSQNVPPNPRTGKYHVHLSPEAESQLFADNHWQRQYQSLPDSVQYKELVIGDAVGCRFFRNTETPTVDTVENTVATGTDAECAPEIGGEIINDAGFRINRTVVMGGGAMYEKYVDESKYLTEGGTTGKIGRFSIVNGGVGIMTDRIRYILRAPLDRTQQSISQTWSWTGDFPIPSDQRTGNGARFKRSVVIEHV